MHVYCMYGHVCMHALVSLSTNRVQGEGSLVGGRPYGVLLSALAGYLIHHATRTAA